MLVSLAPSCLFVCAHRAASLTAAVFFLWLSTKKSTRVKKIDTLWGAASKGAKMMEYIRTYESWSASQPGRSGSIRQWFEDLKRLPSFPQSGVRCRAAWCDAMCALTKAYICVCLLCTVEALDILQLLQRISTGAECQC